MHSTEVPPAFVAVCIRMLLIALGMHTLVVPTVYAHESYKSGMAHVLCILPPLYDIYFLFFLILLLFLHSDLNY